MLIVEDGSGVANSDSYAAVSYADIYFAKFGDVKWAALTLEKKEIALRIGSAYADSRWAARTGGTPLNSEQGMRLPVTALYSPQGLKLTGVPRAYVEAVCEYALLSTQKELYIQPNASNSGAIKSKRVTVGPITTKTDFVEALGVKAVYGQFPKPDMLIKNALRAGSGGVIR